MEGIQEWFEVIIVIQQWHQLIVLVNGPWCKEILNVSKACFVCGGDYKANHHTLDGLKFGEGEGFELRLEVLTNHNSYTNIF